MGWVVSYTPRPLCTEERAVVPIIGWVGPKAGLGRSERVWRRESLLPPIAVQTLDRPAWR